jgi:hypothetical protein
MANFTKQIDADIRDMDHQYDGTWYADPVEAWNLGNPGMVTRNIGLRFTGVTIPKNSTINSAKITFRAMADLGQTYPQAIKVKIIGVAEDNTAEFVASPENSARTRTHTTAVVTWNASVSETAGQPFDTTDIKTIIQEIVNRSGWSSGNALALFLYDNGSTSGNYLEMDGYSDDPTHAAILVIDYTPSGSPSSSNSPSLSPSASLSPSHSASPSSSGSPSSSNSPSNTPSSSLSPSHSASPSGSMSPSNSPSFSPSSSVSPSTSPSHSLSPSASASPSLEQYGIKIKKPGVNQDVEDITDPKNLVFTSAYGVLGLRLLDTITATTDASGNIDTTDNHNIGYPPITILTTTDYNGIRIMAPITWHSFHFNGSRETIEVTETIDFRITDNAIRLIVHAEEYNWDLDTTTNLAGHQYTFKAYYYFNELVETF